MHTLRATHLKMALPSILPVGRFHHKKPKEQSSVVFWTFLVNVKVQLDCSAAQTCKASVPLQANASAVQVNESNKEAN